MSFQLSEVYTPKIDDLHKEKVYTCKILCSKSCNGCDGRYYKYTLLEMHHKKKIRLEEKPYKILCSVKCECPEREKLCQNCFRVESENCKCKCSYPFKMSNYYSCPWTENKGKYIQIKWDGHNVEPVFIKKSKRCVV